MLKRWSFLTYLFAFCSTSILATAQNSPNDDKNLPVIVEAESGKAGNGFTTAEDGQIKFVTPAENYTGQSSPGDAKTE